MATGNDSGFWLANFGSSHKANLLLNCNESLLGTTDKEHLFLLSFTSFVVGVLAEPWTRHLVECLRHMDKQMHTCSRRLTEHVHRVSQGVSKTQCAYSRRREVGPCRSQSGFLHKRLINMVARSMVTSTAAMRISEILLRFQPPQDILEHHQLLQAWPADAVAQQMLRHSRSLDD